MKPPNDPAEHDLLPLLPDLAEVGDVDALITAYAPELKPQIHREATAVLGGLGVIFIVIAVGLMLAGTLPPVAAVLSSSVAFIFSAALSEGLSVLEFRTQQKEYRRRVHERPDLLYGAVSDKFKNEITSYRNRMLGPKSEWHKARDPLKEAQDEANRSVAYWGARIRQEPESDVVAANLEMAEDLSIKFTRALEELDHRSDALLNFLNECYAKLAVLESSRTDYAESQRLAALSEEAHLVVADAEAVLEEIGRQFIEEATRLGVALGTLRALHLKETAGSLPIEEIEHVADRILEVYQDDRDMLHRLQGSFTGEPGDQVVADAHAASNGDADPGPAPPVDRS